LNKRGEKIKAQFNNFNWYNNGWQQDDEKKTFLRISNGAELKIPCAPLKFSSGNSHTIEIAFKARNI
jgi:hypothetical protein